MGLEVRDQPDPAFASLLADPRLALREPPASIPIAEFRRAANRFMARARGPAAVAVTELVVPGRGGSIPLRAYRADPDASAAVVFVHGGGFVLGDLDSHDATCRELAVQSGAAVFAVDYRLAPEHPFPAALDDVEDALTWLRSQAHELGIDSDRLALCGDSAGGQLAAAAALRDVGAARTVRHVALLYPLIDPSRATESASLYEEGFMLTGSFIAWAWRSYQGACQTMAGDPLFDLRQADFHDFPATTIVTAGCDPLRDEGELLSFQLYGAGVPTKLRRFDRMIHGFAGFPQITPAATEALSFIGQCLAAALEPSPSAARDGVSAA